MNRMIIEENIACFIQGVGSYERGSLTKSDVIRRCVVPAHLFNNSMYLEVYRAFANDVTQDDLIEMIRTCDFEKFDVVLGTAVSYSNPIFQVDDGNRHVSDLVEFFRKSNRHGKPLNLCYNVLDLGWSRNSAPFKTTYCLRNHHVFEDIEIVKTKH